MIWPNGHELSHKITTGTAGVASVTRVTARQDRWALIFGASSAGANTTYSFTSPAVVGQGFVIATASPPVILTFAEHGELVRGAVTTIGSAAAATFFIVEFFAPVDRQIPPVIDPVVSMLSGVLQQQRKIWEQLDLIHSQIREAMRGNLTR